MTRKPSKRKRSAPVNFCKLITGGHNGWRWCCSYDDRHGAWRWQIWPNGMREEVTMESARTFRRWPMAEKSAVRRIDAVIKALIAVDGKP